MNDTPQRPAQASAKEPHWVVIRLSHPNEEPVESRRPWRRLHRHATQALAEAECQRLAGTTPGHRYGVYASGISCKVEIPAPAMKVAPAGAEPPALVPAPAVPIPEATE